MIGMLLNTVVKGLGHPVLPFPAHCFKESYIIDNGKAARIILDYPKIMNQSFALKYLSS